jgi:hypothetical protein
MEQIRSSDSESNIEEILTTPEAVRRYKSSQQYLYNAHSAGSLKGIVIRAHPGARRAKRLWRKSDLDAFFTSTAGGAA